MQKSPADPGGPKGHAEPGGVVPLEILDEQLEYYRARAPEYDEWFHRQGRYDRGEAATARWFDELDEVRALLASIQLDGADVLELASGTGIWTSELLRRGATVTAVDAAPEMLATLRARFGAERLDTVQADLFTWEPTREYDVVMSCFFVSHVPDERLDRFAGVLAGACREGGTTFLLDGLREESSTARDHELPADCSQTMVRRLDDGRTFTIVKRFRSGEELVSALARHGVIGEAHRTPTYFQVVTGIRGIPAAASRDEGRGGPTMT